MIDASEKNRFIEIWRGIAVLVVVHFHFTGRLPSEALGSATPASFGNDIGKIGVYIFFVISGYLIAQSLSMSRSLADFYAKRISRIWPLFVVAGIFIFIFVRILPPPSVDSELVSFNREQAGFVDLVMTSFFLADFGFRWVDGVFWSILVELKFYFFAGLFAAFFRNRYIEFFCVFAIVLSLIDGMLVYVSHPITAGFDAGQWQKSASRILHGVLIANYLPFFALGMALHRGKFDSIFNALLMMACFVFLIAIADDDRFDVRRMALFLLVCASFFVLDHVMFRGGILFWFGRYSYALYLFHQLPGLAIIKALTPLLGINLATIAGFASVVLFAWFFSFLAEWRFRRTINEWLLSLFRLARLDRVQVSNQASRPVGMRIMAEPETKPVRAH